MIAFSLVELLDERDGLQRFSFGASVTCAFCMAIQGLLPTGDIGKNTWDYLMNPTPVEVFLQTT